MTSKKPYTGNELPDPAHSMCYTELICQNYSLREYIDIINRLRIYKIVQWTLNSSFEECGGNTLLRKICSRLYLA